MSDDNTTNEPTATGWLRTELRGDIEIAKAYIHAARKNLGALRIIHGVNERIAAGEPGGFFRKLIQNPDGSIIEALTNNGNDTIRIFVPTKPEFKHVLAPTRHDETSATAKPVHVQVDPVSTSTTSVDIPRPRKVEEEEEEESEFDKPYIEYVFWLVYYQGSGGQCLMREWTFEKGYSGKSIVLDEEYGIPSGMAIMHDFVYFAGDSTEDHQVKIFRQGVEGGGIQALFSNDVERFEGMPSSSSTICENGILFYMPTYPDRDSSTYVFINNDGVVVYSVVAPISYFHGTATSMVNNNESAFLYYPGWIQEPDIPHPRGMVVIDLASGGLHDVVIGGEGDADTQDGIFACINGTATYEITSHEDGTTYDIVKRQPSDSGGASVVFTGTSTFFRFSECSQTDDGTICWASGNLAYDMDMRNNATSSSGIGDASVLHGTAIIPDDQIVAFASDEGMLRYNPGSGGVKFYGGLGGLDGYLTQYRIFPASNPDPIDPEPKEEWEFLYQTNINPA